MSNELGFRESMKEADILARLDKTRKKFGSR